jgi:hypothetical protein
MKKFNQIAFLCGYFNLPAHCARVPSQLPGWEEIVYKENEIKEYKKYFYYEFVEFCMRGGHNGCVHSYRYSIQQYVPLTEDENSPVFFLKNITAYVMPYDMLMYSIEIELNGEDLNRAIHVLSTLRSVTSYERIVFCPLVETIIVQLQKLYRWMHKSSGLADLSRLIENGNKLKIFQIVNLVSDEAIDAAHRDELLFELGTLSRVEPMDKNNPCGTSPAYFENILQNNKISFYNNWSALSLLDTFTILSVNAPGWLLDNWTDKYFRLIYVHSLFMKFYLFRLNLRFRKNLNEVSRLEDELVSFECSYCFPKISYNFMPLAIYESIDSGLEISEERTQLNHLIDMENQRREKKNDKKVSQLLFFITLLTMLSTLWDSCCLFNALYPMDKYVGSTIVGYKIVVSILSLIIIIAILIIFYHKGRRYSR